jgi:DNA repair exonuclease SbcCD ATPase subunit
MEPASTELLKKLNEKQQLFSDMLALSKEQVSLLEKDPPDKDVVTKLNQLVDKRQQLMDQIEKLNPALKELEQAAAGIDVRPADPWTQDYRDKNGRIKSIITAIQANDSKCRDAARAVLDQMGNKLTAARENKKAVKAYTTTNAYSDAWFFDKKK